MNAKLIRHAIMLTLISLLVIPLLVGCGPAAPSAPASTPTTEGFATASAPPPTTVPSGEQDAAASVPADVLGAASNTFGFDLLHELHAATPGSNVFISPVSLSLLLQLAYNGADGASAQEIADVLHVENIELDALNASSQAWQQELTASPAVEVLLGNSIWVQQGYQLLDNFLNTAASYFNAEAATLDFASPAATDTINEWVADATQGKIDKLFESLDPNVVTYLINTVYFKGAWSKPFDPAQTEPMPFQLADGSEVTVPMMTQEGDFAYAMAENYAALALPYDENADGTGDVRMVIVLPDEGVALDSVLAQLTPETWQDLSGQLGEESTVILSLPRFKVEYDATLNDALMALGMESAFSQPDFANMIEGGGAWISYIRHKAIVEVNEEGTEAAAVSVGAMELSLPPSFTVNRPFFFAIQDTATETILFMGAVYALEALDE